MNNHDAYIVKDNVVYTLDFNTTVGGGGYEDLSITNPALVSGRGRNALSLQLLEEVSKNGSKDMIQLNDNFVVVSSNSHGVKLGEEYLITWALWERMLRHVAKAWPAPGIRAAARECPVEVSQVEEIPREVLSNINTFLAVHCTEEDAHDSPHSTCRECSVMRDQLLEMIKDIWGIRHGY